jgi:hypothetical protein
LIGFLVVIDRGGAISIDGLVLTVAESIEV